MPPLFGPYPLPMAADRRRIVHVNSPGHPCRKERTEAGQLNGYCTQSPLPDIGNDCSTAFMSYFGQRIRRTYLQPADLPPAPPPALKYASSQPTQPPPRPLPRPLRDLFRDLCATSPLAQFPSSFCRRSDASPSTDSALRTCPLKLHSFQLRSTTRTL